MKVQDNLSEFAKALAALLDEVMSRKVWASVLGVTPAAISQWVRDKTVPDAENLRQIRLLVGRLDGVQKELLLRFDEVALRPAREVSPHGARVGRTFAAYMASPLLDGFLRRFTAEVRSLPPTQQERFLVYSAKRLPDWISASLDDGLTEVLSEYTEGKTIGMNDLDAIFGKPDWTNLLVLSNDPQELHQDDEDGDGEMSARFRGLASHFLSGAHRQACYVAYSATTLARAEEFCRQLTSGMTAKGATRSVFLQKPIFNRTRRAIGEMCGGRGFASHIVAFDLDAERAFGYAWFDSEPPPKRGVILSREAIQVLRANVLPALSAPSETPSISAIERS